MRYILSLLTVLLLLGHSVDAQKIGTPPAPDSDIKTATYVVMPTNTDATDTNNPYGTFLRPRKTIPNPVPQGAIVEVIGTYATAHEGGGKLVVNGTAQYPVVIRGVGNPKVTATIEITGSYWTWRGMDHDTYFTILAPTVHATVRDNDFSGSLTTGGLAVESFTAGAYNSEITLYRNTVHDNGDVNASFDQDRHGIHIGARTSYVWVLENVLARNSGDGIQINAGSAANQASTHHIFVARNSAYNNKQNGFWTKQAVDVVFAENVSYGHRPSNSSLGVCMGAQYAPEHVWFIGNRMWDCDYGIQIASDSGLGTGTNAFIIGNVISNIHDSNATWNANSAWTDCAISLPGGVNRYVVSNTIVDVDAGVCTPNGGGAVALYDNAISTVRADGFHLYIENTTLSTTAEGNFFAPTYRLKYGLTVTVTNPPQSGVNTVVADLGFVSPSTKNFQLLATSPLKGAGKSGSLGLNSYYLNRYGTSIAFDIYGTPRLTPPASGAVEFR